MEKRLEDKVERMTASMIIEVLTEYEIVLVDGDMFGKGRKENTFGICDFDKRRIYIDTNHSQTSIKRTLYHELSHAYHYMHKLDDSENNTRRVEKNSWEYHNK